MKEIMDVIHKEGSVDMMKFSTNPETRSQMSFEGTDAVKVQEIQNKVADILNRNNINRFATNTSYIGKWWA